jgi:hypothetical protein
MRLRAGNHGATAAAKAFTIAVMAAATVAQLLSISHEMTVRHFRCAEHGELTHVVAITGAEVGGPAAPRANDALRTQESDAADAHEHCGVAFTIEGSSCTPSAAGVIGTVSPAPAARPAGAAVVLAERVGVLASAPKTSPPSA